MWRLCNGLRHTPDLRDRFILGAGSTYPVNQTGGALTHGHTFTGDGHNHNIGAIPQMLPGPPYSNVTKTSNVTGTTDNGHTLAPYFSLCYIYYAGKAL